MHIILDSASNLFSTKVQNTNSVLVKIQSIGSKAALNAILLISSLAIFLFGANYYPLFPTNGSTIYAASATAVFLIAAILLKRSQNLTKYWGIAYAFFVASAVNLISDLFAGYNTNFVHFFGYTADPNRIEGLAKVYDTLLVLIPILVLTLVSSANLSSLFLRVGNQYRKWGFGIGALVLVNFVTSVLIFFGTGYTLPKLGSAILWGAVFSFSNSMLEELWVRGLVLKRLVPLIGATGAVLLTSITFAALHFLGVAYFPPTVIPIFVANTLTLGLVCGFLMLKTDSIWGAYLIHAAADLFLFIATLAAR